MAFTFGGGAGFGAPQQNSFNNPAPAFAANFPFGAQAIAGAQWGFPSPDSRCQAVTGFAPPFGAQAAARPFGVQGMGAAQGFGTPANTQCGAAGAPFGQPAAASTFGAPGQQSGFGAGAVAPVTFNGASFGNAAAPITAPFPMALLARNRSDLDANIAETQEAASCIDTTISTLLVSATLLRT